MTVLTGQLVGARDLTVTATFAARLDADGTAGATVAARRDTVADRGGRFRLELPPPSRRQGPITVTALGPNGLPAGEVVVPADVPAGPIRIEVVTAPPTSIRPSADITLGAQVRYHGRVIDVVGDGVPAGLLLVVWGQARDRRAGRSAVGHQDDDRRLLLRTVAEPPPRRRLRGARRRRPHPDPARQRSPAPPGAAGLRRDAG